MQSCILHPSSYSQRWVHSWFPPFIIQLNFFFKVVILFFILSWIFPKLPNNNHLSANHVLAIALNISHEPLESFLSSLPGARRWAYSSNEVKIPAIFFTNVSSASTLSLHFSLQTHGYSLPDSNLPSPLQLFLRIPSFFASV